MGYNLNRMVWKKNRTHPGSATGCLSPWAFQEPSMKPEMLRPFTWIPGGPPPAVQQKNGKSNLFIPPQMSTCVDCPKKHFHFLNNNMLQI